MDQSSQLFVNFPLLNKNQIFSFISCYSYRTYFNKKIIFTLIQVNVSLCELKQYTKCSVSKLPNDWCYIPKSGVLVK